MFEHKPLVGVALSFGVGILIHPWLGSFQDVLLAVLVLLLVVLMFSFNKIKLAHGLLCCFLIGLGSFIALNQKYESKHHIRHIYPFYKDKLIEVCGLVVSEVDRVKFFNKDKNTFDCRLMSYESPWGLRNAEGLLRVQVFNPGDEINYGDEVCLTGKLHRPYNFGTRGNLSYSDYLDIRGINLLMSVGKEGRVEIISHDNGSEILSIIYEQKKRFKAVLDKYFTKNESAMMQAFLLGNRSDIPAHIRGLFEKSGTVHILAISGMNVGFLAAFFIFILRLFQVKHPWSLILAVGLVILYALMTGAMPSVLRATIMTVIFLSSFILNKQADPVNSLFLAGFVILIFHPLYIYDVGFQLSFLCVLGILLMCSPIEGFIKKTLKVSDQPFINLIIQSLSVSLAAWVAVAGLIMYYFEIVTPITLLANLVVVPLSSLLIYLGMALLLAGGIWHSLGLCLAYSIKVILNLLVISTFLFVQCPFSHFYCSGFSWLAVFYYLALLALILILRYL